MATSRKDVQETEDEDSDDNYQVPPPVFYQDQFPGQAADAAAGNVAGAIFERPVLRPLYNFYRGGRAAKPFGWQPKRDREPDLPPEPVVVCSWCRVGDNGGVTAPPDAKCRLCERSVLNVAAKDGHEKTTRQWQAGELCFVCHWRYHAQPAWAPQDLHAVHMQRMFDDLQQLKRARQKQKK
jgi:hypothetical protein